MEREREGERKERRENLVHSQIRDARGTSSFHHLAIIFEIFLDGEVFF